MEEEFMAALLATEEGMSCYNKAEEVGLGMCFGSIPLYMTRNWTYESSMRLF